MKKYLTLITALLLCACQAAPSAYVPEPFAFEAAGTMPIRINVARINVIEQYQPPLRAPNMEEDFPVPPAQAIKQWVSQRLQATGTSGVLEIIIKDASVKSVALPKTKGVKGLFTDDQDARYDARIAVTMRLFTGAQAMSDATADVVVTRSRSIHEKATVFERKRMYHQMTRDMLAVFDREAQERLRHYFTNFIH